MTVKSDKTFEEIVERIIALFRPSHIFDAETATVTAHDDWEPRQDDDQDPNPPTDPSSATA